MMKIFKSLAIITAVVAIAGGGTYALWSDSATITGSTFSAGTMNLMIDRNPIDTQYDWAEGFAITEVAGASNMLKNLYPGYPANNERNFQVIDIIDVDGTVPNSTATIKFNRTSGTDEMASSLKLRVYFDAENNGFGDDLTPLYDAPLSHYTGVYTLGEIDNTVETLGNQTGKAASVKIEWYVPTSAGNEIQGDSVTVDTTFGLQQS